MAKFRSIPETCGPLRIRHKHDCPKALRALQQKSLGGMRLKGAIDSLQGMSCTSAVKNVLVHCVVWVCPCAPKAPTTNKTINIEIVFGPNCFILSNFFFLLISFALLGINRMGVFVFKGWNSKGGHADSTILRIGLRLCFIHHQCIRCFITSVGKFKSRDHSYFK